MSLYFKVLLPLVYQALFLICEMSLTAQIASSDSSFKLSQTLVASLAEKFGFKFEDGWSTVSTRTVDNVQKRLKRARRRANPASQVKHPRTAFSFFTQQQRPVEAGKHKDATFGQLSRFVSEAWKALTPVQLQTFKEMEAKDKARYQTERAAALDAAAVAAAAAPAPATSTDASAPTEVAAVDSKPKKERKAKAAAAPAVVAAPAATDAKSAKPAKSVKAPKAVAATDAPAAAPAPAVAAPAAAESKPAKAVKAPKAAKAETSVAATPAAAAPVAAVAVAATPAKAAKAPKVAKTAGKA